MEIQYEHENDKGELATVSTVLKFGTQNEFLQTLMVDGIPARCAAGPKMTKVQPADLFPYASDYYAYAGSETKPPCRRTQWYVYKQPATVSLIQWVDIAKRLGIERKYTETCGRHGCTKTPVVNGNHFPFSEALKGNVRPLQVHNNRLIRASAKRAYNLR
jgi:carbonic anhydrase